MSQLINLKNNNIQLWPLTYSVIYDKKKGNYKIFNILKILIKTNRTSYILIFIFLY